MQLDFIMAMESRDALWLKMCTLTAALGRCLPSI